LEFPNCLAIIIINYTPAISDLMLDWSSLPMTMGLGAMGLASPQFQAGQNYPPFSGYGIGSEMSIGLGCGYEEEQQREIVFGSGSQLMSNRTER
jgi:hypothetical protein